MPTLVVGIGNQTRGDDGVGPAVAATVAELAIPGVEVVVEDEPLALLERFATHDVVVVVDAVKPNGHPGRVHTWLVGAEPLPRLAHPVGSHGLGVVEVLELSRALGQLPRRLVIVGVEATSVTAGAPLTVQVIDRLDDAVRAVIEALARSGPAAVPGSAIANPPTHQLSR